MPSTACSLAVRLPDAPPGRQAGLDFSVPELLHTLAAIQDTVLLQPSAGDRRCPAPARRPHPPIQQRPFELCGPGAYIPALRSYTPVATNQPSASANTIGDQENRETRAGSFMRWHLDRQPEGAYR
jgi:hypothetical protein